MGAVRELFVREAVLEVLRQCDGMLLPERTVMSQVNLSLAPNAAPKEIGVALDQLMRKGRIEFEVDPDDPRLKKWRIRKVKTNGHD